MKTIQQQGMGKAAHAPLWRQLATDALLLLYAIAGILAMSALWLLLQ